MAQRELDAANEYADEADDAAGAPGGPGSRLSQHTVGTN